MERDNNIYKIMGCRMCFLEGREPDLNMGDECGACTKVCVRRTERIKGAYTLVEIVMGWGKGGMKRDEK